MPAARDSGADDRSRTDRPALLGGRFGDVGFLDVPTLDVEELSVAIREAFRSLAMGAVLAVYSDHLTAPVSDELWRSLDLDLIATVRHPDRGTTFTLKQSGRSASPAAADFVARGVGELTAPDGDDRGTAP